MKSHPVGYLDPDVAASVGQLVGPSPGRVRVNGREVLASTTQLVGAEWGETHRNVLIALTMTYVERGKNGIAEASLGKVARVMYGWDAGGEQYKAIAQAIADLHDGKLTIADFDVTTGEPAPGMYSSTHLLIDLVWHKDLERVFEGKLRGREDIGRQLGAVRGRNTIRWRFHPGYAERVDSAEVISLDWDRLRALRGVAQGLWIQLSAPRFPFAPVLEQPGHERLELTLDPAAYQAFGISARQERDCRRTLNCAGERIVDADPAYELFEAHGGRNTPSRLVVVRRAGAGSRKAAADSKQQLVLLAGGGDAG